MGKLAKTLGKQSILQVTYLAPFFLYSLQQDKSSFFFHDPISIPLSYFYDPGMFIFRWSSNFVEKVVLNESMSAKMASRVSYLVYYYCI